MTTIKTNEALDDMVAQVRNRRNAPATVPATATATNAAPELSGSVEQAREITRRAAEGMRDAAAVLERYAEVLRTEAAQLDYGMDLVFSVYTPGPKPVNVEEARKKAEAEADARQAQREREEREPASEETVAEMLAAAPPILAKPAGWSCPDHGQVTTKYSQRNKRDYLACPVDGCGEIERRA